MEMNERQNTPWIWVVIVLLVIILGLVIWRAVEAQRRPNVVVVPAPSQPAAPPPQQPAQPAQPSQPVVVQPQQPVNIYINTRTPNPQVYIVPKGQQPPSSVQNAQQVNLPAAFRYDGRVWTASDQAVTTNTAKLKEIGEAVNGNPLYTNQDAEPPYTVLYLETSPGSGIFLRYDQSSGNG